MISGYTSLSDLKPASEAGQPQSEKASHAAGLSKYAILKIHEVQDVHEALERAKAAFNEQATKTDAETSSS